MQVCEGQAVENIIGKQIRKPLLYPSELRGQSS
jgi:hypothetical protein